MISGWTFFNFICERFDFYPKREQKRTAAYYLRSKITVLIWQGHKDLNPEPTVLETAALPIELYPYILSSAKA